MTRPIHKGQVCDITYRCTTPGPEEETGIVRAYWTGEVDPWGKLTIIPVDGQAGPLYLFRHELEEVEPL